MFTVFKKSDDRPDKSGPIFVKEGYSRTEDRFVMPEVGKAFIFGTLITTPVTEVPIQEEGYIEFKTRNSTYIITYE